MIPDAPQLWRGEGAVVADRVLNGAIIHADISYGYEQYLEIVDRFYADDIEIGSDTSSYSLRGKERLKAALRNILAPIHMMAEIAGLEVSMSESPIPGDSADVQHSEWSLELIGVSGRRVKATWCVRRISGLRRAARSMSALLLVALYVLPSVPTTVRGGSGLRVKPAAISSR